MRLIESYILFYAVTILLSGLLLMGIGVQQIEVYYSVYLIEFLAAVTFMASFRRSLERHLGSIIIVFFLGFIYIVAQRILQILS